MTRDEMLANALTIGLTAGERQALDELIAEYVGPPETWSRCTGYGPCGGCDSCIIGQATYGFEERAKDRYRRAKLGLLVAPILLQFPPWMLPWPACCATWEHTVRVREDR